MEGIPIQVIFCKLLYDEFELRNTASKTYAAHTSEEIKKVSEIYDKYLSTYPQVSTTAKLNFEGFVC